MKFKRFEQLPVWKAAIELAQRVDGLTRQRQFHSHGSSRDQIERTTVSISNNIAGGFDRRPLRNCLHFCTLRAARGGEVRPVLCLMGALPDFGNLKSEISDLKLHAEGLSRQLQGWADALKIAKSPASVI